MQNMIIAVKTFRIQLPALIFTSPLPPSNLCWKACGVRFKQAKTLHSNQSESESDIADNINMDDKALNTPAEKIGDVLSHSFGEGYATRCDDDGFGGIYGGNESIPKTDQQNRLIHENHPAYDKSQGSEVREKEKGRHQPDASA